MVVLETVVPVFAVVALGAWLAGRAPLDADTLAELALRVTTPALLFDILSRADLDAGRFGALVGGALFVAAGSGVLALGCARAGRMEPRSLVLPAAFWNAGNMALPVARLAFGEDGLEASAVVFVVMALLQSSAGVWIAKGRGGFAEALRLPLLWAALAGLGAAALEVDLPRMVREPVQMLGAMAIPLMLLHLGAQLRSYRVRVAAPAVCAAAIRSGGGLALGLLFVALSGISGVTRDVLLVHAVMPPAVVTGVLAQRYGAGPEVVASAIALGTLASVAVIPLLLAFLV